MNRELNKPNKIYLEKLKKNNIDFSNNMKNIFNNIGNITRFKSDKNIEERKRREEEEIKRKEEERKQKELIELKENQEKLKIYSIRAFDV